MPDSRFSGARAQGKRPDPATSAADLAKGITFTRQDHRTGLAVTDTSRIIASALDTVPTKEVLTYLERYLAKEPVDGFVIGLPMKLNNTATDATPHVLRFIEELKKRFPKQWVDTVDERFTSSIAQQTLMASGKGRMARRDKGALDRISATIILQSWMERQARI